MYHYINRSIKYIRFYLLADTSTTDYFNGRAGVKVSVDTVDSYSPVIQQRKPSLSKTDSIDVVDCKFVFSSIEYLAYICFSAATDKKLYRGISRATDDNVTLVSRARSEIAMDFHTNCYKQPENLEAIDSPDFTFTLPDISIYSEDFRKFLEKDLIECSTLNSLEMAQRLNWWADSGYCRRLWPLSTSGDGNCLLHAASLAMWGFHDRKLTLRSALHAVLSKGEYREALWRRWRFHQTRLNRQAGFVYSEAEWSREWEEIVALASPEPRHSSTTSKGQSRRRSVAMDRQSDSIDDNATYESLEEIHIFALSHVLRRTIIVVADTVLRDMNGEAMAPIPFGGVYLPFEIPATDCHRAPLLLTYDMAHFSALVSMESSGSDGCEQPPALIPLIDFDNVLLPIQFCIDPGQHFDWSEYDGSEGNWALSDREHIALLKEYLDVVYASPVGTPEDEICEDLTDEEYEKRIGEAEIALSDDMAPPSSTTVASTNGKSKAAKQLQSVAKQFGSIGKSMSKKIKKNIGSITKIGSTSSGGSNAGSKAGKKGSLSSGTSTQSFTRLRILCAQLKSKRYEYQEEMIRNYLECAQDRFVDSEKTKALRSSSEYDAKPFIDEPERKTCCINAGCQNYGTSLTSYMCPECFEKQKQQELNSTLLDPPRYGTGNSRFYTQSDSQSHQVINRLPSVRRLNELDQTLYLSNSTFYNDKRTIHEHHAPAPNGTSFRHGYSPTEVLPMRKLSAISSSISPTAIDADRLLDFYRTSKAVVAVPPPKNGLPGTASVYSPGKTIIHNIVRQTVNLPPMSAHTNSVGDTIQIVSRNAYSAPPPFPVVTSASVDIASSSRTGGVATPFAQSQAKPCRTIDCMFFGSANSNFYCSKCCQQQLKATNVATAAAQSRSQSKVLTDV